MKQSTRTTIADPYSGTPSRDRHGVSVYFPSDVHQYLNRKLFGGTPGAMNAVVNTLVDGFIKECKRRSLPEQWEPETEGLIKDVLADLNFTKKKGKK
jgi:hypothetical protein